MNFNSSEYFAYKKNKIQQEIEDKRKPISRFSFLCQLFFVTFVIIFIIIVVSIMKYSAKMDIEYAQGELQLSSENVNSISNYAYSNDDDKQKTIDKRLLLIQQEENAPSEARIVEKNKNHPEVIASEHLENNKKLEKLEKRKKLNEESEKPSKIAEIIQEVKLQNKVPTETMELDKNITVMSKVLLGRYATFEEAQKLQNEIKAKDSKLQPFVRKVGEVYSVQMGSYQDFSVAKGYAQTLRAEGYDVWIYQQ